MFPISVKHKIDTHFTNQFSDKVSLHTISPAQLIFGHSRPSHTWKAAHNQFFI